MSIKAGDIVTCQNGHELYRFTADAVPCSVIMPTVDPVMDGLAAPVEGEAMSPCPKCGGRWFRHDAPGAFQMHFADGWRGA